jgi:hypothetical protein
MANLRKSAQPPPPPPPLEKMDDLDLNSTTTKVGDGFQSVTKLKAKDFVCEYYDAEVLSRNGILLQYVNMNSMGATNMVGVSRTSVTDPRKMPAYLSKYKTVIRSHAVGLLKGHFDDTQCSTGATENISHEDYSISFSWASISEEGRRLNPFGRNELPLAYAAFDNWVEPNHTHSSNPDTFVYVINVWIMLQESTKRKRAVLKRARDDEAVKVENAKKPKFQRRFPENNQETQGLMQAVVHIGEAVKRQASAVQMPPQQAAEYPYLPVGGNPDWIKTGSIPLPAE